MLGRLKINLLFLALNFEFLLGSTKSKLYKKAQILNFKLLATLSTVDTLTPVSVLPVADLSCFSEGATIFATSDIVVRNS